MSDRVLDASFADALPFCCRNLAIKGIAPHPDGVSSILPAQVRSVTLLGPSGHEPALNTLPSSVRYLRIMNQRLTQAVGEALTQSQVTELELSEQLSPDATGLGALPQTISYLELSVCDTNSVPLLFQSIGASITDLTVFGALHPVDVGHIPPTVSQLSLDSSLTSEQEASTLIDALGGGLEKVDVLLP